MSGDGSTVARVMAAVAAVLVVFVVVLALASLEQVERRIVIPPSGAARENPLLAAERLLERMGFTVTSVARLDELPPPDHTLLLAVERRVLTRARAERLEDWVIEGGYLIVGPYLDDGRPVDETHNDVLLDAFGVTVAEYEPDEQRPRRDSIVMTGFMSEQSYEVEFFADYGLAIPGDEGDDDDEDDDQTYAMIWNDYGEGKYAVVKDLRFVRSGEIGRAGHAGFLSDLVAFGGHRRQVRLVHGLGRESLSSLVVRHAWVGLLVAGVSIACWIWRRAVRFGPPIVATPHGSRALIEHVDGLGHFLWRSGHAAALLESTRAGLRRRIQARRPDFASKDRQTQVEMLAIGTDVPPPTIDAAMFGHAPTRRDEFTRAIRTLERLRREL